MSDYSMSLWRRGCDDAKSGMDNKHAGDFTSHDHGYRNGYRWGQIQLQREQTKAYAESLKKQPEPPLKNPYMEGIEAIEGILDRLQTFTKEYPSVLDTETVHDYIMNLLSVRDQFHGMRLEEIGQQG